MLILLLAKLVLRFRVENRGAVPLLGGLLVASNHVSHLDPPLVGTAMPRLTHNMAKRELLSIKLLEWFMRSIGTIIVDRGRGRQALIDAAGLLARGECILIFPEGTRSVTGRLGKGHSGAIVLAVRTGCAVLPAAIIGSNEAMRKGTKRIRPHPVTVRFGEPYRLDVIPEDAQIPRELLERECFRLMERIEALLPEHMRPSAEQKCEWYGAPAGE